MEKSEDGNGVSKKVEVTEVMTPEELRWLEGMTKKKLEKSLSEGPFFRISQEALAERERERWPELRRIIGNREAGKLDKSEIKGWG